MAFWVEFDAATGSMLSIVLVLLALYLSTEIYGMRCFSRMTKKYYKEMKEIEAMRAIFEVCDVLGRQALLAQEFDTPNILLTANHWPQTSLLSKLFDDDIQDFFKHDFGDTEASIVDMELLLQCFEWTQSTILDEAGKNKHKIQGYTAEALLEVLNGLPPSEQEEVLHGLLEKRGGGLVMVDQMQMFLCQLEGAADMLQDYMSSVRSNTPKYCHL
jgi:serine kinase of HPr protein (carbohydrate metabolism regulator)